MGGIKPPKAFSCFEGYKSCRMIKHLIINVKQILYLNKKAQIAERIQETHKFL